MAYKDEPAIAGIEITNERTLFQDFKHLIPKWAMPEFRRLWNRWLVARYASRTALARAWSEGGRTNLRSDEDPAKGTVRWPGRIQMLLRPQPISSLRWAGRLHDARRFVLELQSKHYLHMRDHLRSVGSRHVVTLSASRM